MWDNKKQRIDEIIIILNQSYVRTILRVKRVKNTEFGAKISAICIDGYIFLHRIS